MKRDLRALAARRAQSLSSLVREALAYYLEPDSRVRELSFVAAGRSGRSDVASAHEELLARELAAHEAAPGKRKLSRRTRGRR